MEGANMNTSTGMSNNGGSERYVPSTMAKVTIATIFGIILLVGIVGNILVIVIIASVKTMRTAVNKCLFSLALADSVILIVTPFLTIVEKLAESTFSIGENFCKFSIMYSIAARILTSFTFYYVTIDRYFALCYPLKPRRFWTAKLMYVTLLTFWIVSFVMSVPFLLSTEYLIETDDNVTYYNCYFVAETWLVTYQTCIIVFVYFVPVPILIIMYGRMIHHLKKPIGASDPPFTKDEVRGRRGRGQVVIMLLVLIVIFVLSQLPLNLIVVFYYYLPGVLQFYPYDTFTFVFVWVSRLFIYVNSAANPVIYFALSTNFRQAFHKLFCCPARNTPDNNLQ